jgi:hypothetical protein
MANFDIKPILTGHTVDDASAITTRSNSGGPIPHGSIDANWDRISSKINEILSSLTLAQDAVGLLENVDHTLPVATSNTLGGVKVTSGTGLDMNGEQLEVNTAWINNAVDARITTEVQHGLVAYAKILPSSLTSSSLHNCQVALGATGEVVVTVDDGLTPNHVCVPIVSSIPPAGTGNWPTTWLPPAPTIKSISTGGEGTTSTASVTVLQHRTEFSGPANDEDAQQAYKPYQAVQLYIAIFGN